MSSVINTVYKRPSSILTVRGNDEDPSPQHNGNLIITCMWVIVALAAAARTEFSSALAGCKYFLYYLVRDNQCCVYRNDHFFNCNRCSGDDTSPLIDDLGLRKCKKKQYMLMLTIFTWLLLCRKTNVVCCLG